MQPRYNKTVWENDVLCPFSVSPAVSRTQEMMLRATTALLHLLDTAKGDTAPFSEKKGKETNIACREEEVREGIQREKRRGEIASFLSLFLSLHSLRFAKQSEKRGERGKEEMNEAKKRKVFLLPPRKRNRCAESRVPQIFLSAVRRRKDKNKKLFQVCLAACGITFPIFGNKKMPRSLARSGVPFLSIFGERKKENRLRDRCPCF